MGLAHLTRYFVVNCHNQPVTTSPLKLKTHAYDKAREMNTRNDIKGWAELRPYSVVELSARKLVEREVSK